MEVSNSTANTNNTSTSQRQSIADSFDTFLTLLTTQLQNQDPLSPTNTEDFTQQLVQFAGVEQSIKTNSNLEELISLSQDSKLTNAVSYLGKEVELNSTKTALRDGKASWTYQLDREAASSKFVIRDEAGDIVFSQDGKTDRGEHKFTWDGEGLNGKKFSDGTYTLSVEAEDASEKDVSVTISTRGLITSVEKDGDDAILSANGVTFPLSEIKSIFEPSV